LAAAPSALREANQPKPPVYPQDVRRALVEAEANNGVRLGSRRR
jgi:hypothetical protein